MSNPVIIAILDEMDRHNKLLRASLEDADRRVGIGSYLSGLSFALSRLVLSESEEYCFDCQTCKKPNCLCLGCQHEGGEQDGQ